MRRSASLALPVLAALALVSAASGAAGGAPAVTVTQTATGMNDVAGGGFEPPDVQVAAGVGFVVEMVNLAERAWRTGAAAPQELQTIPLASLFGAGGDDLTDPRILYDAPSGRWLASISDITLDSVLLAVSQSGDPTAGWRVYTFGAPGCADQPRLGVADGVVVLGANVFTTCDVSQARGLGGELWVVNKQQLLAGAATAASTSYGPDPQLSSLAPVQSLSATATEYVVSVDDPSSAVVHLLTVDGVPPAAVRVHELAALPIATLFAPPPAAQPAAGGGRRPPIATNDERILDSVWEKGKLWFSANSGCVPVGDTAQRACARVVELSTAAPAVDWQTDLGVPGADLFFPAVRPDAAGDLVIALGESSDTVAPELAVVVRTADGTFTAPAVVAQSPGDYLGDRYGDYFGAARDPSSPATVWVAGETGTDAVGRPGWSTAVAAVTVTGATPPTVAVVSPPGVRARASSGRAGTAVRLLYRALDDGQGVRSVVTVRGTARVVFRATGAKATLRAGRNYAVVWRPVRSLRGRYTFCVHTLAPDGSRSPESCARLTLR